MHASHTCDAHAPLLEFISQSEAVDVVDMFYEKGEPPLDACRYLIAKAALAWREHEGAHQGRTWRTPTPCTSH